MATLAQEHFIFEHEFGRIRIIDKIPRSLR